jgi:hypothetical protein
MKKNSIVGYQYGAAQFLLLDTHAMGISTSLAAKQRNSESIKTNFKTPFDPRLSHIYA